LFLLYVDELLTSSSERKKVLKKEKQIPDHQKMKRWIEEKRKQIKEHEEE